MESPHALDKRLLRNRKVKPLPDVLRLALTPTASHSPSRSPANAPHRHASRSSATECSRPGTSRPASAAALMKGRQDLFIRDDEGSWRIVEPVLPAWPRERPSSPRSGGPGDDQGAESESMMMPASPAR